MQRQPKLAEHAAGGFQRKLSLARPFFRMKAPYTDYAPDAEGARDLPRQVTSQYMGGTQAA